MEFRDVVARRRMVRSFQQRSVRPEVIERIIDTGRRAPSAGFSQGLELLVLDTPETVSEFWRITEDPASPWDPNTLAAGPPVLVLPIPDKRRYLQRYAEPDKRGLGMEDEAGWPVPFWDVDAGMAAMLMLLAAVDAGLGAWFFGFTHGERALMDRFGVPPGIRPIGVVGLGYRAPDEKPTGSWLTRARRPLEDQIHRNAW
jgi:nitroreductase